LISEESNRILRDMMVDTSPCISVVLSAELNPLSCNETAVEYLGYATKEELLENFMHDLIESIPAFQPDASPTIPLQTRIKYVVENGNHDFEMEIVLNNVRVPLRFMLRKAEIDDTYVIICFMLDTQSLKEARNELLRHDFLMRQVNRAATRLLSAKPDKFDSDIVKTLTSLAQGVGACQMAIFENNKEDEAPGCQLLYNWSVDGTNFLYNTVEGDYAIDYAQVDDWYETLAANRRINDSGASLIEQGRDKYFPRATKAFMMIPVFLQKSFWGIIVVAKSSDDQLFSNAEERAVQSGGILIVAAILRNQINQNLISAREAAMASERAKSLFLSRMSHEIRTPLNAILGMTAIAQKTDDPEHIKYSLQKIEMASGQLLNLVNDILDMSKIETGKLEMLLQPFDFMQMLQKVIEIQKVDMQSKNHTFKVDCKKPFERYMITDELRLSQVLINLLGNAVKFTPEGGNITLRIDYNIAPENGGYILTIEVQDDGIGVSHEQQHKLFQSFEQADGSITRRFGGSGLGLAICKSIVQLLGGDIILHSDEGKGSCFVFDIRFALGDKIVKTEQAEAALPETEFSWHNKHILLAEDIDINREIVLALLADTGLNITCAEDGCEAVALFKKEPEKYCTILMDIQMPKMDGLEATRQIRSLDSLHAKNIPIIAMTANAFSSDVDRCLEAGMNEHISKPIDFGVFIKKLSAYI